MEEHERHDDDGKKLDIEGDLGVSRRDMMKRAAIVGGTLVWAAPAIQSIGARAAQAYGPSPGTCAACYCYNGSLTNPTLDLCTIDGVANGGLFTGDDCDQFCKGRLPSKPIDGPYEHSQYCSGFPADPKVCNCRSKRAGNNSNFGVTCP